MENSAVTIPCMNDTSCPALKRLAPGHYVLTDIPGYRIFKHTGRSWSGRLGSYAWTKWVMLRETDDGFEKDYCGHHREVLEASTIEGLKDKMARYFTPSMSLAS